MIDGLPNGVFSSVLDFVGDYYVDGSLFLDCGCGDGVLSWRLDNDGVVSRSCIYACDLDLSRNRVDWLSVFKSDLNVGIPFKDGLFGMVA